MIPGWTHNIINLSETENLVTVMTCNEIFNPEQPDTFFEEVVRKAERVKQNRIILHIHFQDNGKLKLLIIRGHAAGNYPAGGGDQQMPGNILMWF